uniref:Uncharacterized protein n=1 Tax=Pseudictyota dubia TaxID=2749911 RepID=A0A7R9ZAI4_9STRA|mmetsp:Transcript_34003/g.62975  ORF Transcript_34003/g.62975 Transcript_34003/m.62975 type:complete len:115 (+) Transcript_34003:268-612(+)
MSPRGQRERGSRISIPDDATTPSRPSGPSIVGGGRRQRGGVPDDNLGAYADIDGEAGQFGNEFDQKFANPDAAAAPQEVTYYVSKCEVVCMIVFLVVGLVLLAVGIYYAVKISR